MILMNSQNGSAGHIGGGHFIHSVRHVHILNHVFPFDNDMKKAHFGTKLCIYHEKTVSVYQRNTIFTVYLKKSGN
jgi:hypothetical protein